MRNIRRYLQIIFNIVIPLAVIWAVCFLGPRLVMFFMPFVLGWIVAMIANPLVRFLEKKLQIVRRHSSIVLIVGVLALVITGIYLLVSWMIREIFAFVGALPDLYSVIQAETANAFEKASGLLRFLPDSLEQTFSAAMDNMGTALGKLVQDLAASAGGAVARSIPGAFVGTVVMLISSYLFLAEHDRIKNAALGLLPKSARRYLALFQKDLGRLIGGYFLAQFKIMFVVALVLLVGFLFLGVKHSISLAILIAFLDFLPMFGTGTALIPWALVKLFGGEFAYAFGLVLTYVVSQVVRQVIQPKLVGDTMGLPPLTTLFFLYMGFKIRGLAGMILAVPVGIVFINFYRYGAFDSLIENVKLLAEEIQKIRDGK